MSCIKDFVSLIGMRKGHKTMPLEQVWGNAETFGKYVTKRTARRGSSRSGNRMRIRMVDSCLRVQKALLHNQQSATIWTDSTYSIPSQQRVPFDRCPVVPTLVV
jgi:hypothetical protein